MLRVLIGFILNSVLMRTTGKIPDDDLIYPVLILFFLCLLELLNQRRVE